MFTSCHVKQISQGCTVYTAGRSTAGRSSVQFISTNEAGPAFVRNLTYPDSDVYSRTDFLILKDRGAFLAAAAVS